MPAIVAYFLNNVPTLDWTFILGFVCPCFIILSDKSTNQMHQSLRFIVSRLTLNLLAPTRVGARVNP